MHQKSYSPKKRAKIHQESYNRAKRTLTHLESYNPSKQANDYRPSKRAKLHQESYSPEARADRYVKKTSLPQNDFNRIKRFEDEIQHGLSFICVSCEKILFKRSVYKVNDKFLKHLETTSFQDGTLLDSVNRQ